jgi:hypothetical protein
MRSDEPLKVIARKEKDKQDGPHRCSREREERERERERERDTHTHRDRDRSRERQRATERDREREIVSIAPSLRQFLHVCTSKSSKLSTSASVFARLA